MRRICFGFLAALLFLPMSMMSVIAAQDATPAAADSAFADLGLPTLDVTVTADSFEGIPNSLEAGRYLVTVAVGTDVDFASGVAFVQPSGMTAEELLNELSGPPAETQVEAELATPVGGEEGMDTPPDFIYDLMYAGGAFALAGASAQVVLDLGPGEWVAWADDPMAMQEPVVFEVTGDMPTDLPEPEAGATLTMEEYEINVIEGELTSGQQVIRLDNTGEEPHFLAVLQGPDDMTEEQIAVLIEEERQAETSGTPPSYSELNPEEDFMVTLFTATQSPDTSLWVTIDLQPGRYVLACFFPDEEDGRPHADHGMYTVVEIAD